MKLNKIISLCLAFAMAVTVLSGCGKTSDNVRNAVFEDTEEKLTITWLGFPGNAGSEEGSSAELAIEEKFNVDIKPIFYEQGKFNEKKTMLMAGGEIPDLIYELDPANVVQDVEQDFIVEVPYETIKQYAPSYADYVSEYVPMAWLYSRYEGKNWGIPNFDHTYMISQQAVYREDWLRKFNMEVPKTLDELHDVLYKMSNEDPDGNGKKDTYGMAVYGTHFQYFFPEIFGAYGCLPFDWQEKDGKIVYGGITDECKETLKLLSTWYSEGIIHPDFVLGDGTDKKFVSGTLGYFTGNTANWGTEKGVDSKLKANVSGASAIRGRLPAGTDGQSGIRAWGNAAHVISFGKNEGYEKKIPRILKIMEALFTDKDFYLSAKLGKEGEQWQYNESLAGTDRFEFINGFEDNTVTKGLSGNISGPTMFAPITADYDTCMSMCNESYLNWIKEWTDVKYCQTGAFYKPDIVPSSADYLEDLRTKQIALMCDIIRGAKSIDDYAEFEEMWNSAGGVEMTEEANRIHEDVAKMYEELGIEE